MKHVMHSIFLFNRHIILIKFDSTIRSNDKKKITEESFRRKGGQRKWKGLENVFLTLNAHVHHALQARTF